MDVSIIIINYNTCDLVINCVKSIVNLTNTVKYEIIIVDNHSRNCSLSENDFNNQPVTLIHSTENMGFARANNLALQHVSGKYVLFLNSDTYFINNVLDKCFEFAEGRNYKVLGASLFNEDGSEQKSYYNILPINWWGSLKLGLIAQNPLLGRFIKYGGKRNKIGGLYGAFIFMHKSVIEKVGPFDPDFFMYSEDIEWFRNRINKRFDISICKEAKLVHIGSQSQEFKGVNPDAILSFFLYWYKLGLIQYVLYCIGIYVSTLFVIISLPFMSATERKKNWESTKIRIKLIPRILFDIPRYKNKLGGRPQSLRYHK